MSVTSVDKDVDSLTLTLLADFDSTPAQVWQLWADPRQLERWWGPPATRQRWSSTTSPPAARSPTS